MVILVEKIFPVPEQMFWHCYGVGKSPPSKIICRWYQLEEEDSLLYELTKILEEDDERRKTENEL